MSLEAFQQRFPAEETLNAHLKRIGRSREGGNKPPVIILATMLLGDSSEELRRVFSPVNDSGVQLTPISADFLAMPLDIQEGVIIALAGIAFSNSILSIHETLVDQHFDAGNWFARYNHATQGTLILRAGLESGTDPIEAIPLEGYQKMLKVAEDKSLAGFFKEEGIQHMPNLLRQILEQSGLLPAITEYIVPIYLDRTKFLVG